MGFAPSERPRVAVAADGTLAAIHEPTRITVVEVPSCSSFAELGTDPQAAACDVAWVGTPPRLLVLSRYKAHTAVHLVDPLGPRTIAEIRLESPMTLHAAVGTHALAIGATGAVILAASDKSLTPYQFPARALPLGAGAAGTQFVVALAGSIEEWDPQSRMPKRRLKLPRPAVISAVGGSDRVVWMTTQHEPARIDVLPLVNRGQPKHHDLPEPIASIASHPRSDVIACIGATSGRVWVVDLDGRAGLRLVGPEGIDRAESVGIVLGRVAGVLAAQAQHAITIVTLDRSDTARESGREASPSTPPPRDNAREASPRTPPKTPSSLTGPDDDDGHSGAERPTSVTLATPPADEPVAAATPNAQHTIVGTMPLGPGPAPSAPRAALAPLLPSFAAASAAALPLATMPGARPIATTPIAPPVAGAIGSGDARRGTAETIPFVIADERRAYFTAFRQRVDYPRARTAEPIARLWLDASGTWRDDVIAWTRRALAGAVDALPQTPIDDLVIRLHLSAHVAPIAALLYGNHLLGSDGAAPLDVANLGGWDDALGRGGLADLGLLTYHGSRVRLSEVVRRALDELPPRTGTLIGACGSVSLLGPCVIVAAGPLAIIADACLPSIGGAILAAHADADAGDLVHEARAYGAAPLWRVRAEQLHEVPAEQPIILVADDDITADLLGVPRLT